MSMIPHFYDKFLQVQLIFMVFTKSAWFVVATLEIDQVSGLATTVWDLIDCLNFLATYVYTSIYFMALSCGIMIFVIYSPCLIVSLIKKCCRSLREAQRT